MTSTYRILPFSLLFTVACSGTFTIEDTGDRSPDDPASFSSQMFDRVALASFTPEDRAYVQGHALSVYLFGKTLPSYVGGKGYRYEPGVSAPEAGVAYVWASVMTARSGGINGYGDVAVGYDGDCDPFDPDCGGDGDGDCDPFAEDCDEPIDEDCEEFLDPAAIDARRLQQAVDPLRVFGDETPADAHTLAAFYKGMSEALLLEDLHEDTSHSEVEHIKSEVRDEGLCTHSPLVLDLNGDGLAISDVSGGVDFDLLSLGSPVRTAWIQDDDALLVLDRDGDGRITSGKELFGNNGGHESGFSSLADLDSVLEGGNEDGVLDARDARFAMLQVWNDWNRDGLSSEDELRSLADVNIVSIDLRYQTSTKVDEAGNAHRQEATFVRGSGKRFSSHAIVDVWFRFRPGQE